MNSYLKSSDTFKKLPVKVHQSRTEQVSSGISEISKEEIEVHQLSDQHCDNQSMTEQVSSGVSEIAKEKIGVHQLSDHYCDNQSRTGQPSFGLSRVFKRGYSYLKLKDTFKKLPIKVHQSSDQTKTEQFSSGASEVSKEEVVKVHQSSDQNCDQSRTEQVPLGVNAMSKKKTCNLAGKEGIVWSNEQNSESAAGKRSSFSKTQKRNMRRRRQKARQNIPSVPTTEKEESGASEVCKEEVVKIPQSSHQHCDHQSRTEQVPLDVNEVSKGKASNLVRKEGIAWSSGQNSESAAGKTDSFSKSQKRNMRRQRKKERQSIPSVLTTEKEEAGEKEREGSDISILSSVCHSHSKKPREDFHPTSFTQDFRVIKIAITKEGFPLSKLSKDEYDIIQMEIIRRIDIIPSSAVLPKIHSTNLVDGAMIISCNDMTTVHWLSDQFDYNGGIVNESTLKVLSADCLPKLLKVAFKTKDTFTMEPGMILRRLHRFNPGLKSENWHVLQRFIEPQSIKWIFEVEQEAAEAIKQAGYVAFTGLDQGFFKILNNPTTEEQYDAVV